MRRTFARARAIFGRPERSQKIGSVRNEKNNNSLTLIEYFKAHIEGLNSRRQTLDDLYSLIEPLGIEIALMPMNYLHGCAFYEEGVPYLFINNTLPPTEQLIAGFHEFTHLVYHSINHCEFSSDSNLWLLSKAEHQSQTIGVLSAMPFQQVIGLSVEDVMREFKVSRQTAEFRLSLYF